MTLPLASWNRYTPGPSGSFLRCSASLLRRPSEVVAIGSRIRSAGYRGPVDVAKLAAERLGFRSLRPGQREAVEAVVSGRDVLAVMATGSGKTAIYQLAGMILPGATVVVSPLI